MSENLKLTTDDITVRLPSELFRHLILTIDNVTELKLILYTLYLLYKKNVSTPTVTCQELASNQEINRILSRETPPAEKYLQHALDTAIREGVLLHLSLDFNGKQEDAYLINKIGNEESPAGITGNTKNPADVLQNSTSDLINKDDSNIFKLYEENIGMLTPMIADQLKEAEQIYPNSWIKDAFRESASLNKRSWRYIEKILQRWNLEGKEHGPSGRYTKENDPDKYIKGKYGHIVRR